MLKTCSCFCLLLSGFAIRAQVPDTELWLFRIQATKTATTLGKPKNITQHPGYDNQAVFSADSRKIWYVSMDSTQQTDIFFYDLRKNKSRRFTKTPVSEYSPVPDSDGRYLTSVTVEGDSSQYIHYINAKDGIHEHRIDADSVGYYTFLNTDTVVYYKLTNPHSLRYRAQSTGQDHWLANTPARAFRAVNRHTLIYATKDSVGLDFFSYDFLLRRGKKLCSYPSPHEDFIYHNLYGLVKSEDQKLLRFDELLGEWLPLFDLSGTGIKRITRFDIDAAGKWLVVTDNL